MSKKQKLYYYEHDYNELEDFAPLIGGGEFRWYFKHLGDSVTTLLSWKRYDKKHPLWVLFLWRYQSKQQRKEKILKSNLYDYFKESKLGILDNGKTRGCNITKLNQRLSVV
ncbi:hypothetical protein CL657_03515 [bacterium]|nr:hypothetical protein [bacterium]